LSASVATAGDLTPEQRVDAREAIERVYAAHREGSRRSFDETAPRSLLEQKVRTDLKRSVALERFWNTPLTAKMLDRELERMIRNTAMPDRLEQLFAALQYDPVLIREELVRPVLARRLTRNFFDKDERIPEGAAWDDWWRTNASAFDESEARTVALGAHLPYELLNAASGPEGSCAPAVGTWDSGSLDDGLIARNRHSAVWTGTEMLVFGGAPEGYPEGARYDPATDSWTSMSRVGTPMQRRDHNAAWTGSRMIVWGGELEDGTPLGDGGLYDPVTDSWTAMSTVGAPTARSGAASVWTGTQFLVWGGAFLDTGGVYDPVANSWSSMSTTNAPSARIYHTAVWTGSQMVIWGGRDVTVTAVNTGARYNPGTDSWAPTRTINAPPGLEDHTAVWSGSRMIVWSRAQVAGGIYNAASNGWSPINDVDAPSPAANHSAVWTGSEMLIYGGYDETNGWANDGARLDPVSGVWTPISEINAPFVNNSSTIWTGTTMIVWAGKTGGRYDVATDSWTPVYGGIFVPGAGDSAVVWTGNLLLHAMPIGFGVAYDPVLDSWYYTSGSGSISQFGFVVAWSGDEMLVWGGYNSASMPGTRYDPVADQWTPMSTEGGPPGHVVGATAAWIGSGMFVWGGLEVGGYNLDVGGVYDPRTDSWRSVSTVNAPIRRRNTPALWTGSKVLIWGGLGGPVPGVNSNMDDGAQYDPATDTWTPISQVGVPTGRRDHSVIWTGSKMIMWGGNYRDSGGLYDPVTDTWTPTSLVDVPEGRHWHSAIWTGREMVVWGGRTENSGQVGTGGIYDPVTDTWQATTMEDAPSPRRDHGAVWTGTHMIVWTGGQHTAGRYVLGDAIDDDGDGLSECAGDCNDGNAAVYLGAAESCNGLDDNCNAIVDDLDLDLDGVSVCGLGDCNDGDSGAFAVPQEVLTVSFTDASTLEWDSTAGSAGNGTVHDIVIGLVSEGAPGGGASETCMTAAAGTSTATHAVLPLAGDVFWYLVRGRNSCGSGSYGVRSDGAPRSTATCP
jgi:N-acetylneuraminic acid mutarotase